MRRIASRLYWLILVAAVTMGAPCLAEWKHYPARDVIETVAPAANCLRVEEAPELDAVADERAWQQLKPQVAWVEPSNAHNRISPTPLRTRFLYDEQNIYVFFEAGAPPAGTVAPPQSKWYVRLIIDPRPDHINVPWVELNADGSARLDLTTFNIRFRDEDYKTLAQPQGKTVITDGCLRGEFAIPIAGLMADPPAVGDAWDLDFALYTGGRRAAVWCAHYALRGRLRFVSAAPPLPAYGLTRPALPITPHHGSAHVSVAVERLGDGPAPTEIVALGMTGLSKGEAIVRGFSQDDVGNSATFVVDMPAPGWGAVRLELRRAGQTTDVLMLPVQIEPQLKRFLDTVVGSFECHVSADTPAVGKPVTGRLDFAPFEEDEIAHVSIALEATETVDGPPAALPHQSMELGGESPLTVPFALATEGLPCGWYRVSGDLQVRGKTYHFTSPRVNLATTLVTEYDAMIEGFQKRFDALTGKKLEYEFQRDCAEFLLYMLRRHAPEGGKFEPRSVDWPVQLDGMLAALEANRDYFYGRSGPHLCAYRSRVDGSLQPYEVNLPRGFDKARKWPVILGYHGTYTHYYHGVVGLTKLGYKPLEEWPVIGVGLEGRHPIQQLRRMCDVDLLEVYDQLGEHFGMDAERVSLTGFSRGAWTSCYFASQLPHLFAASAPCAHFGYEFFSDAPNMRHVHFCPSHAVHDERCEIGINQTLLGLLKTLGGNVTYRQCRTGPHTNVTQYRHREYVENMILSKRERYPRDVQFVCSRPRYGRAYWVSIERLIEYGKSAKVSVAVTGASTLEIATENVGALSLDLTGGQVRKDQPVEVRLNGKTDRMSYADRLWLEMEPVDNELVKNVDIAGPIGDWMFEKSLIVYGTQAGGEVETACKQLAEEVSKGYAIASERAMDFVADAECSFPVKADGAVSAEDVADCNLVLIGGPGANLISSRIAEKLPVRFAMDGLRVGDLEFSGPGATTAFIYPNPENRKRYVVVVGAADPSRKPTIETWRLRDLDCDLMVLGAQNEVRLPTHLFFDAEWQLQQQPPLCEVPVGLNTDWDTVAIEAMHKYGKCDVAIRHLWRRNTEITPGPLYYSDVKAAVGAYAGLVAFKMTGAQLRRHLQSWITLYGSPPTFRGMTLEWHIDSANKMARIDSTSLKPTQDYWTVGGETTLMRPCWDAGEDVEYRLLGSDTADAVARYLQEGNLPIGK